MNILFESSFAPIAWTAMASLGVAAVLLARYSRRRARRHQAPRAYDPNAARDPLTGLPTRQLFEGLLSQSVQRADAQQQSLALLLVNLDGFKPINQSFGHLGGDHVLREVAARLRALAMPHMAARMSGDEFLLLLGGDPQVADASSLARRVIDAIGAPFRVEGREATISCSVGVTMYPDHGAKSTMIAHAHAAMGAAKAAGGASHAFFEPRMLKSVRDDVELLRDLRLAMERKQLELYYQPKIHAPTGEITGAEALMRWHHPQRGMISPALFIPIAERYGLIGAMGHWVIDEACHQVRTWRDEGLRMRVAVNLSVHQLRQADLADWIGAALKRHQINPDLITCEVTESSAMDDTEVTIRVLSQLDKLGVHISIDDFGTGHSSLAYLRKLPADELKIDRSFVMDLETSEDARKVAVAVINLAKALDLKVVAEGVETEGQNRILREFGCDQLQGFLFAKPMSAKALALWAMDDVGPRTMSFRASLFTETMPSAHA
ncbi:MAG: bifunctional diguanylate cyclase/phosphodiesterase [Burkholderiales bacterium]